jgi:hypothetical protein
MFERITRTRERISNVGTLDEAHDIAVAVGIGAERAGMTITDRDNPSVTELAREAARIGIDLRELFTTAGLAVR